MPLFVFRSGIAVAVPPDYAQDPQHRLLVDRLTRLSRYSEVVTLLEQHPNGFLAADLLTGAPWAQKFLNSTARLAQTDPKQARRGLRALLWVLNGTKPRPGRHRDPPLDPTVMAHAADALARWQIVIDRLWGTDRASLTAAVRTRAAAAFVLSQSHQRALRALVRRPGLRKRDLVLALASWETGLPLRRLRGTPDGVATLIYA